MNRGDVYWADVPFEEDVLQGKRRPVVIASDRTVYVVVLRVTSHAARLDDPYDYALQEWRFAGLTKESVVRVRKIAQLRPEAIGEYIGRYIHIFEEKLRKYNNFDNDISYIRLGRYKRECSAIGAAKLMQNYYIEKIETFSVGSAASG